MPGLRLNQMTDAELRREYKRIYGRDAPGDSMKLAFAKPSRVERKYRLPSGALQERGAFEVPGLAYRREPGRPTELRVRGPELSPEERQEGAARLYGPGRGLEERRAARTERFEEGKARGREDLAQRQEQLKLMQMDPLDRAAYGMIKRRKAAAEAKHRRDVELARRPVGEEIAIKRAGRPSQRILEDEIRLKGAGRRPVEEEIRIREAGRPAPTWGGDPDSYRVKKGIDAEFEPEPEPKGPTTADTRLGRQDTLRNLQNAILTSVASGKKSDKQLMGEAEEMLSALYETGELDGVDLAEFDKWFREYLIARGTAATTWSGIWKRLPFVK